MHAAPASDDVVAELMHEHQDAEHHDERGAGPEKVGEGMQHGWGSFS